MCPSNINEKTESPSESCHELNYKAFFRRNKEENKEER